VNGIQIFNRMKPCGEDNNVHVFMGKYGAGAIEPGGAVRAGRCSRTR
jgi:hypothetical protein